MNLLKAMTAQGDSAGGYPVNPSYRALSSNLKRQSLPTLLDHHGPQRYLTAHLFGSRTFVNQIIFVQAPLLLPLSWIGSFAMSLEQSFFAVC